MEGFKLNQIVRLEIDNTKLEPFNPFARVESETVIITAIDRKSNLYEVAYLRNRHQTLWVDIESLHVIEHVYDPVTANEPVSG